jgi:hypothetical protein
MLSEDVLEHVCLRLNSRPQLKNIKNQSHGPFFRGTELTRNYMVAVLFPWKPGYLKEQRLDETDCFRIRGIIIIIQQ